MNTKAESDGQNEPGGAKKHPCARKKIPIIPVRYAVAPKSDGNSNYAYSHKNLDQSRVELKKSLYTLRTIRPGYIYLFDGAEIHLWEAQGNNVFIKHKYPSLEEHNRLGNAIETTTYIWTWKDRIKVEIGYVPDLLTAKTLKKTESDAAFRATFMYPLEIAELIDGGTEASSQKHTLSLLELPGNVEGIYTKPQRFCMELSKCTARKNLQCTILKQQHSLPRRQTKTTNSHSP